MNGDLPQGWALATLSNLTSNPKQDIISGPFGSNLKSEEYVSEGVPIIRLQNVDSGRFLEKNMRFITAQKARELSAHTFQSGDIVITKLGDPLGKACIVPDSLLSGIVVADVVRVRIDERRFLKNYVVFAVNSPSVMNQINSEMKGSTRPRVNLNQIRDLEIPVPPLAEQQRIVAKLELLLGQVDACQQRLDKIPALLKRFRQSVLAAACSGKLTDDWREENGQDDEWTFIPLRELCNSLDYGSSAKSQPTGKVPVLRMGNIQNGEIDWTDLVYTSDEEEIRKYRLKPKTVLFNRTNSPELVGKTAIYLGERPAIFAGYLIRVNHCPELDPKYLNFCLNTNYAREFCQSIKTDGVSQSNINAQKLGSFEVPFCPLPEQQEIVRRVERLFALADSIEQRYKKAQAFIDKLTPSLLAKAFRGELVPQDPNDEPASVLLGRIGAGKPKKRENHE